MVKNHAAKEAARNLKAETGITYPRALDLVRGAGRTPGPSPRFDDLGLPAAARGFATVKPGLFIFAGPTGSGRTTSLAAVLNMVTARYGRRVTVIEEVRELPVSAGRSVVEFVTAPPSACEAVEGAVRDVREIIVLGDTRDGAAMLAALRAADAGHTVFLTMHAASAEDAVKWIVDLAPAEHAEETAALLGTSLRAILFQKLLPAVGGSARVPAVEVLMKEPGEAFQGTADSKTFITWLRKQPGTDIPLAVSLSQLVLDGLISERTAEGAIGNPMDFRRALHAGKRHSSPFITLGTAGTDDVRTVLGDNPHLLVVGGDEKRLAALDYIAGRFPGKVVRVSTEDELEAISAHVESIAGKLGTAGRITGFQGLPEDVRPERQCVLIDFAGDPFEDGRGHWPTKLSMFSRVAGYTGVMLLVGAASWEHLSGVTHDLRTLSGALNVEEDSFVSMLQDPVTFTPVWQAVPAAAPPSA